MAFQSKKAVMAACLMVLLSITPSAKANAQSHHRRQLSPVRTDPNNIPIEAREEWCAENMQACSILCSNDGTDEQPSDRTASMNSCSPPTLQYNCQCSDGSWPPLRDYITSIPGRICEHSSLLCFRDASYKMKHGEIVFHEDETGRFPVLEELDVQLENFKHCNDTIRAYCAEKVVPGMLRGQDTIEQWLEDEWYFREAYDGYSSVEEVFSSEESMDQVVTIPVEEPTREQQPCATPLKTNRKVSRQVGMIIAVIGMSLCIGSIACIWAIIERAKREWREKRQQILEESWVREKASENEVGSDMEKEMFL